jgi:signal transduction histidine kinase
MGIDPLYEEDDHVVHGPRHGSSSPSLTGVEVVLASLVAIAVLWLAVLLLPWLTGRKAAVRELALLLPNLARLFHGLLNDPRVPVGSKVLVLIGLAWFASPIDLIPEFVPVIGPLDDAIVGALILRHVVRTAGRTVVTEHWHGDPQVLALIFRAAGIPDTHLIVRLGGDLRKSPPMHRDWRGGVVALGAIVAIAAIGYVDLVTPPEVDFELFYLAVVIGAAWWIGRSAALVAGVTALVTELLADDVLRPEMQRAAVFNAALRLVVYVAAAFLTGRLYEERERHRARDAERNTFLGVLEREFPRPIAALRTLTSALRPGLVPGDADALAHQRAIEHHAQDIEFLATDLLAIGDLQRGHLRLRADPVDLREIVREAVAESLRRDQLHLSTGGTPVSVRADPDRLRHAVASVISKAIEAAPYESVEILVRDSADYGVVEIRTRARLEEDDLDLARLLMQAQAGKLMLVAPDGTRGMLITLSAPHAVAARSAGAIAESS